MERNEEMRSNERVADEDIVPGNEQNGGHFTTKEEIHPGEGMLHHGRPLSEMEIEELRIHKANNEFLGIPDVPEKGTGSGNAGGVIPDAGDFDNTDELDDRHNPFGFSDEYANGHDSNFGRNYMAGLESQNHFIEESRKTLKKKEEKKQRGGKNS